MKVLNANIFFDPICFDFFKLFHPGLPQTYFTKIYVLFDSSFELSLLTLKATQIYQ